jgi:hypothetical protein
MALIGVSASGIPGKTGGLNVTMVALTAVGGALFGAVYQWRVSRHTG